MKEATGRIYDYIITECPYCKKGIEESWGRINDLTIPDPSSGEEMECPHCKKIFILNLED